MPQTQQHMATEEERPSNRQKYQSLSGLASKIGNSSLHHVQELRSTSIQDDDLNPFDEQHTQTSTNAKAAWQAAMHDFTQSTGFDGDRETGFPTAEVPISDGYLVVSTVKEVQPHDDAANDDDPILELREEEGQFVGQESEGDGQVTKGGAGEPTSSDKIPWGTLWLIYAVIASDAISLTLPLPFIPGTV